MIIVKVQNDVKETETGQNVNFAREWECRLESMKNNIWKSKTDVAKKEETGATMLLLTIFLSFFCEFNFSFCRWQC